MEVNKTLNDQDCKLIFDHPNLAADALEEYEDISDDVVAIVRQHHEHPKGHGFPGKISHQKITALSSVFIVAHDFAEYIMNNPDWKFENYYVKAKDKFKGTHFNKIISALRSLH
jgi:HD-GYP domain-containing protein (c-di-GMP phosphodiesterase class II)